MSFRILWHFAFFLFFVLLLLHAHLSFGSPTTNQLRLSTQLQHAYSQESVTYNHANVAFDTKTPAFNPDRTDNVLDIECKDENVIIMKFRNEDALHEVQLWPTNVILMIDHKWRCFNKEETLFYMTYDIDVNFETEKVTFQVNPCNMLDHAHAFSLDLTYHKPDINSQNSSSDESTDLNKPKKIGFFERIRNFFRNLFGFKAKEKVKAFVDNHKKINVFKENVIDLDVLYDSQKNSSSKPDFALTIARAGVSQSLICMDCYMHGKAVVTLHIKGEILPKVKITKAIIALNGDLEFNFDIRLDKGLPLGFSSTDIRIMSLPLSPFSIPGLFGIGPELSLSASAGAAARVAGKLYAGVNVVYRNFHINASLTDDEPHLQTAGFNPIITTRNPSADLVLAAHVFATLKPRLALGINLLNGAVNTKAGLEFISRIGAKVEVGAQSICKGKNQLLMVTSFDKGLRWFVKGKKTSSLTLIKRKIIGSKCINRI